MMSRDEVINELTRVDITAAPDRTVFLHGYLDKVCGNFYDATVVKDRYSKPVRLMQSAAPFTRTSNDTALIEIPLALVTAFVLQAYVLSEAETAKFRKWAEEHNAPYLQATPAVKPEKLGNIRI